MYRGNWGRALLSRAVAVAVLCLLGAWIAGQVGELELAQTSRMSHTELKQYVLEGAEAPFTERYLTLAVGAVVFVTLVEARAGGIRIRPRSRG